MEEIRIQRFAQHFKNVKGMKGDICTFYLRTLPSFS